MATVLNLGLKEYATHSVVKEKIEDWVKLSIEFAARKEKDQKVDEAKTALPAQLNTQSSAEEASAAVVREVKKGYDMLLIGLEQALLSNGEGRGSLHAS